MTDKAKRKSVRVGTIGVEGFQMPDGSYRMSQASAALAVGLGRQNGSDFLRSKAIKRLLGEGYTGQIFQVEVDSDEQDRGQTRINALPLEAVNAYWHWQSHRGNKAALALCMALSAETLDRRFDDAFDVIRSATEYNESLSRRMGQFETQLSALSDAYAAPDIAQEHISRLEDQLRQAGIEPWQPPSEGET